MPRRQIISYAYKTLLLIRDIFPVFALFVLVEKGNDRKPKF